MSQDIDIDAGEVEYCDPPLLITADFDITADTVSLGLGGWDTLPTTWVGSGDPAARVSNPTPDQVQGALLIGDTIAPATGVYWMYMRVVDNPETLIVKSPYRRINVTNTGTVNYT